MGLDQNSLQHSNAVEAFNKGTAYVNESTSPVEHPTICVLGPARSGTSMVARALAFLGVPMGVPVPAPSELVNYEDQEFVAILHGRSSSEVDRDALLTAIERRNAIHSVWGFKLPMAIGALDILVSTLRNPRVIFVFRDLLAVAIRENIAVDQPLLTSMQNAASYYLGVIAFLQRATIPCWLISYEKAIQDSDRFTQELVRFSGINPPAQRIAAALQQIQANHPEYLNRVIEARQELGLAPL